MLNELIYKARDPDLLIRIIKLFENPDNLKDRYIVVQNLPEILQNWAKMSLYPSLKGLIDFIHFNDFNGTQARNYSRQIRNKIKKDLEVLDEFLKDSVESDDEKVIELTNFASNADRLSIASSNFVALTRISNYVPTWNELIGYTNVIEIKCKNLINAICDRIDQDPEILDKKTMKLIAKLYSTYLTKRQLDILSGDQKSHSKA